MIVGAVQAGLFVWQLKLIRESLADAEKAADAAALAADAARRQAETAETTLHKRERPYLFVFGVERVRSESIPEIDEYYHFVEYSVANYGAMPAILEKVSEGFEISDKVEPPLPIQIGDEHPLSVAPILAPGERREIKGILPIGMATGDAFVDGESRPHRPPICAAKLSTPEGSDLFFRVVIEYRGPFSHGRETAALWLNDAGTWDFNLRGGEEYNYSR